MPLRSFPLFSKPKKQIGFVHGPSDREDFGRLPPKVLINPLESSSRLEKPRRTTQVLYALTSPNLAFYHHTKLPILAPTWAPQNHILPLRHPLIPPPIIILIDPLDQPTLPNLNHHTNMTNELLPTRLHCDLSVRPHDVVRASTAPDLLDYGACGGRVDGLCGGDCESVHMLTRLLGLEPARELGKQNKPSPQPETADCNA
jgi:hypothetical protein